MAAECARRAAAIATLLVLGALPACGPAPDAEAERRYDLAGRVLGVDAASGRLTVEHEAIPGYMEAMTMELAVADRSALERLSPGDRIRARLVVDEWGSRLEAIEILEPASPEAARERLTTTDPELGWQVPPFELVDQDGDRFRITPSDGRVLVVTFIFTRCPLPDFCLRMSENFAEIDRALRADAERFPATQLVSISIDPDYDTPSVMRRYGLAQLEGEAAGFRRWTFATGSPAEVGAVARAFGLAWEGEGARIVHSLRTAVVDGDGRLVALYRGNGWRVEELLRELERLGRR